MKNIIKIGFLLFFGVITCKSQSNNYLTDVPRWENINKNITNIGKPEWTPMLQYVADLHKKSTHPAVPPFIYDWEEIGPGYIYGPAFGHWDLIHQILDVLPYERKHAKEQLLNNLSLQLETGFLPGSVWMPGSIWATKDGKASFSTKSQGHPPMWVVAVSEYQNYFPQDSLVYKFYPNLLKQIKWFETERKAIPSGFFYNDILTKKWESGVDEGIRFDKTNLGAFTCIDATCHVYLLYKTALDWAKIINVKNKEIEQKEKQLKNFINDSLYCTKNGFFYDIWAMHDTSLRGMAFEGLWPLIVGAISQKQANKLIDEYVLNPNRFFTPHPLSTVGAKDPKFELRMWRGPSWNSMTYWVVRGCILYNRKDAALKLLESALDATAYQFAKTGTIWEFYHPFKGNQEEVLRKPQTKKNTPCKDYLGHNPVIAMARIYQELINENKTKK